MVMRYFRRHFVGIIWAVIIVFIAGFVVLSSFSYVQTKKNTVFKIGKKTYPITEYYNRVEQLRNYFYKNNKEYEEDKLKRDALDSFVSEATFIRYAKDLGVKVGKKDIQNFIRSQKYFLDENENFSYDRYIALLKENNFTPALYEAQIRLKLLTDQLNVLIQNTNIVPPLYLNDIGRLPNLGYTCLWTAAEVSLFNDKVKITDQDINSYYSSHLSDYFVEPLVKIAYKELDVMVTEEEEKTIVNQLNEIKKQLKAGKIKFEDAAKAYSEGPTGAKGGELGWFDSTTMVKDFTKIVFALKKGEISEPFKTQFGYHIVEKEDSKIEDGKEKVRARHILMKIKASDETKNNIYNKALEAYSQMSKGGKIDDLFKNIKTTNFLIKNDLPYKQMDDIFDYEKDDTAGYPFFVKGDEEKNIPDKYVVYQLLEKKSGYYKKIVDIKEELTEKVRDEKIINYLEKNKDKLVEKLSLKLNDASFTSSDRIITDIFGDVKEDDEIKEDITKFVGEMKEKLNNITRDQYAIGRLNDVVYIFQLKKKSLPPLSVDFSQKTMSYISYFYKSSMVGEFIRYLKKRYGVHIYWDRIGIKEERTEDK